MTEIKAGQEVQGREAEFAELSYMIGESFLSANPDCQKNLKPRDPSPWENFKLEHEEDTNEEKKESVYYFLRKPPYHVTGLKIDSGNEMEIINKKLPPTIEFNIVHRKRYPETETVESVQETERYVFKPGGKNLLRVVSIANDFARASEAVDQESSLKLLKKINELFFS